MKMLKVFDCQSMPKKVRISFFDNYRQYDNDCYVSYYNEFADYNESTDSPFVKWLFENGMTNDDEIVLINHWW